MGRRMPLTERERELMGLLKTGLSYKDVGWQMGITYATVAASAHNIRRKLQIDRNVTLQMAIKAGLDV